MPVLVPIQDNNLEEFCEFLHQHLNPQIPVAGWVQAFSVNWIADRPNYGFLLRDDSGRVVGGIGAIYSEQMIRGQPEHFCNISSWCVLEDYRSQSMRLAMAVVLQKGYHFTDLTPTAVVADSLRFLKFKPLDSDRTAIFNLPWPSFGISSVQILTDPKEIETVLPNESARIFHDNRGFPWLKYAAVGRPGAFCAVIFRQGALKRLPSADIVWLSDSELFTRYYRPLGSYLLFHLGMATTFVESRFLTGAPLLSSQLTGYNHKMYRSDTLRDSDIANLYTELVCLDL